MRTSQPTKIRRIATRIKICGLARGEDALLAARLGAEFLGVVLAESPRQVRIAEARAWVAEVRAEFPHSRWVGVFVRPRAEEVAAAVAALGLDLVQLHGCAPGDVPQSPVPVIRAVAAAEIPALRDAPKDPAAWAVLVDRAARGGTGETFDWSPLKGWRDWMSAGAEEGPWPRLFLAGGLGPDNVADAIRAVRPYAVDASSRLEAAPGRKDPEKVRAFIAAARATRRSGQRTRENPPGGPDNSQSRLREES